MHAAPACCATLCADSQRRGTVQPGAEHSANFPAKGPTPSLQITWSQAPPLGLHLKPNLPTWSMQPRPPLGTWILPNLKHRHGGNKSCPGKSDPSLLPPAPADTTAQAEPLGASTIQPAAPRSAIQQGSTRPGRTPKQQEQLNWTRNQSSLTWPRSEAMAALLPTKMSQTTMASTDCTRQETTQATRQCTQWPQHTSEEPTSSTNIDAWKRNRRTPKFGAALGETEGMAVSNLTVACPELYRIRSSR